MSFSVTSEPQGQQRAKGRGLRCQALALATALVLSLSCKSIAPDLVEPLLEVSGPFPEDYVEIVRRWIDSDFYDLSTITGLSVSTPISGHSTRWPSRKRVHGWYSKVTFKARDSLGANKGKMAYAVLLYEGAIQNLERSRLGLDDPQTCRSAEVGIALGKALSIIGELRAALDHEAGGKISQNLDTLYEFSTDQISQANVSRTVEAVENTLQVLRTLKEGWDGIIPN